MNMEDMTAVIDQHGGCTIKKAEESPSNYIMLKDTMYCGEYTMQVKMKSYTNVF